MRFLFHKERESHPIKNIKPEKFFDKEDKLIRSEFREKLIQMRMADFAFIGSVCFFTVALTCLAFAGGLFLATEILPWKAAGIVAIVFLSISGLLFGAFWSKNDVSRSSPERSLRTLQEFKNSFFDHFDDSTRH